MASPIHFGTEQLVLGQRHLKYWHEMYWKYFDTKKEGRFKDFVVHVTVSGLSALTSSNRELDWPRSYRQTTVAGALNCSRQYFWERDGDVAPVLHVYHVQLAWGVLFPPQSWSLFHGTSYSSWDGSDCSDRHLLLGICLDPCVKLGDAGALKIHRFVFILSQLFWENLRYCPFNLFD